MDTLLDRPVHELARLVQAGELSPVDLVDVHIARVEAVNPMVNAMVADRFAEARAEARAATEALAGRRFGAGKAPPLPLLHGVPCTIKEFFGVQGMPWTGGMMHRQGVRAGADATVVDRLRAAGAIVMGVSNAPEGGLWMETYNALYGRTRNPWDLRRTSGGSSGGEGALVASGASPFGMGSDVGGSIRIPAAFCGVAGHKATGGLVPNTGHFPPSTGQAGRYLCSGPLARSVTDLELILELIAGPDGRDPACDGQLAARLPPVDDLRGVTVVALETNGRIRVRPEVRAAVRRAAEALQGRGATLREVEFADLRHAFEIWTSMLSEHSEVHYAEVLTGGGELRPVRELVKLGLGRSDHTFAPLVLTLADRLVGRFSGSMSRFIEVGRSLQHEVEHALGDRGVLLFPPYSRPAPRHRDAWRTPFDAACTAIFNVLELPVTQVPAGFSAGGLPLGVQVVGSRGADRLTLAVGRALEEDLGGWVRAEPLQR